MRKPGDRRVYYLREEVERLKEGLDQGNQGHALSTEFFRQRLKVQKLEEQVEFLLGILQAKSRVSLEAPELVALYRKAISLKDWDYDSMLRWYQVFDNLTDEDFLLLQKATGDIATWKPFFDLCCGMIRSVKTHRLLRTSLKLQHLHALLVKARRTMRDRIVVLLDDRSPSYERLFGETADPWEEILSCL